MNNDLISRTELKKCAIPCQINNGALTDLCVPLYQIDNAPTVEAYTGEDIVKYVSATEDLVREKLERPQGKWMPQGGGFSWVFKCSCCGWVDGYPLNKRHKYCPNCGADMKGDKK